MSRFLLCVALSVLHVIFTFEGSSFKFATFCFKTVFLQCDFEGSNLKLKPPGSNLLELEPLRGLTSKGSNLLRGSNISEARSSNLLRDLSCQTLKRLGGWLLKKRTNRQKSETMNINAHPDGKNCSLHLDGWKPAKSVAECLFVCFVVLLLFLFWPVCGFEIRTFHG